MPLPIHYFIPVVVGTHLINMLGGLWLNLMVYSYGPFFSTQFAAIAAARIKIDEMVDGRAFEPPERGPWMDRLRLTLERYKGETDEGKARNKVLKQAKEEEAKRRKAGLKELGKKHGNWTTDVEDIEDLDEAARYKYLMHHSKFKSLIDDTELIVIEWTPPSTLEKNPHAADTSNWGNASDIVFDKYDPSSDVATWVWNGTTQGGMCTGIRNNFSYTMPDPWWEDQQKWYDRMKKNYYRAHIVLPSFGQQLRVRFPCVGTRSPTDTTRMSGTITAKMSDLGVQVFNTMFRDDHTPSILTYLVAVGDGVHGLWPPWR